MVNDQAPSQQQRSQNDMGLRDKYGHKRKDKKLKARLVACKNEQVLGLQSHFRCGYGHVDSESDTGTQRPRDLSASSSGRGRSRQDARGPQRKN